MTTGTAEPVVRAQALLGECPLWDSSSQVLLWLDFRRQEVHLYEPATGVDRVVFVEPTPISAMALRQQGGLVAAAGRGFVFFDPVSAKIEWIVNVEAGDRMNDGACDPAGRFLAGTMTFDRQRSAGLYRLDTDLSVHLVLAPVTVSNGLGWAPNGRTFYYVDTPTCQVVAFDYDVTSGTIKNGRLFADLRQVQGRPDGLTVDAAGHVWVAMFGGGAVRRYAPDGHFVQAVPIPTLHVTSCCFGGPDLQDLYVTSASRAMTDEQLASEPLAGAVFSIRTDARGQQDRMFVG